jgi:conjugal transfer mating pair stabilization protein TraG
MIQISPANRVSLIVCKPGILAVLPVLEAECARIGLSSLLVTSGSDGTHRTGSLHPRGLALDFTGVTERGNLASIEQLKSVVTAVKHRLGVGFDVVLELFPDRPARNHGHVERDPQKRPLDAWESGDLTEGGAQE